VPLSVQALGLGLVLVSPLHREVRFSRRPPTTTDRNGLCTAGLTSLLTVGGGREWSVVTSVKPFSGHVVFGEGVGKCVSDSRTSSHLYTQSDCRTWRHSVNIISETHCRLILLQQSHTFFTVDLSKGQFKTWGGARLRGDISAS